MELVSIIILSEVYEVCAAAEGEIVHHRAGNNIYSYVMCTCDSVTQDYENTAMQACIYRC